MKKIITYIIISIFLCSCSPASLEPYEQEQHVDTGHAKKLDLDIASFAYLLADLSDMKILYQENSDFAIYPASLTKIATLDTVLSLTDALDATSSLSAYQIADLIRQDASLAYLKAGKEYRLDELLYALIMPSGADAAIALENYFSAQGLDLVEQMNEQAAKLGCSSTHFENSTGLHDDDHRMSLDDLLLFVLDALRHDTGRQILTELFHRNADGGDYLSSLLYLGYDPEVDVLGGKTGFTEESGQSVTIFYRHGLHSYVLMLANADGDPREHVYQHFIDALHIFEHLY